METEQEIVHVTQRMPALSSPSFIVERGGRFYVTLAVLEYDPDAAVTPEQKRGVEQIRDMFEAAQKEGGLRAGHLQRSLRGIGPMNTGPHPH